jgi:hypothetical protein
MKADSGWREAGGHAMTVEELADLVLEQPEGAARQPVRRGAGAAWAEYGKVSGPHPHHEVKP